MSAQQERDLAAAERRRTLAAAFHRGDRVRIDRDETRYPARGSWPRYRDRKATVVVVNRIDGEVGVTFSSLRPKVEVDAWFLPHELTKVGQRAGKVPLAGAEVSA